MYFQVLRVQIVGIIFRFVARAADAVTAIENQRTNDADAVPPSHLQWVALDDNRPVTRRSDAGVNRNAICQSTVRAALSPSRQKDGIPRRALSVLAAKHYDL